MTGEGSKHATITVYAGWQTAPIPEADEVGMLLAKAGFDVCYGGGADGNMGAVAQGAHWYHARVTAVTRQDWVQTIDHEWDELVVKESLVERMAEMERRADAFLVLPGGSGTDLELYSIWVDAKNGHHSKPIVVMDPSHHFDSMWARNDELITKGATKPDTTLTRTSTPSSAVWHLEHLLGG